MECSVDTEEILMNVEVEIKEEPEDDDNDDENNGYFYNSEDIKLPLTIFLQPEVEPAVEKEKEGQKEEKKDDYVVIVKHEEDSPLSGNNNSCSEEEELATCSEEKIMPEKLRHSLNDAVKRQSKRVRNGVAATTLKPWKFQAEMGFLQPYRGNGKGDSDVNDESSEYKQLECEATQEPDSVVELTSEEREDESGTPVRATVLPGNSKKKSLRRKTRKSPSYLADSSREYSPTPQKQIKRKDDFTKLLQESIENREKRAAERAAEITELLNRIQHPTDPLYHFFMSLYETTKNMPLSSQHIVKNHIYKAVMDMEASLLKIPKIYGVQKTSEVYQHSVQYQFSPSTSDVSYSENSSHKNSTMNKQNASSKMLKRK